MSLHSGQRMHETGFSSSLTWVLYLGLLSLARGEAPRHAHIMECGQRAGGGTAVLAHGSEGPLGSHRYRRHGEDLRGSVSSRRGTVEASTVLSVVAVCGSCQRPAGISVFRLRAIRWPAKVYGVHPTFGLRCFPRTDGIRNELQPGRRGNSNSSRTADVTCTGSGRAMARDVVRNRRARLGRSARARVRLFPRIAPSPETHAEAAQLSAPPSATATHSFISHY